MQFAEAYPQSFGFSGSGMASRGQFDPGNKSFHGQWLVQERPRDCLLTNECWEDVCWTSRKDIHGSFLPLDPVLWIRCLEHLSHLAALRGASLGPWPTSRGRQRREREKLGPCDVFDQLATACSLPLRHCSCSGDGKPLIDKANLIQGLCHCN